MSTCATSFARVCISRLDTCTPDAAPVLVGVLSLAVAGRLTGGAIGIARLIGVGVVNWPRRTGESGRARSGEGSRVARFSFICGGVPPFKFEFSLAFADRNASLGVRTGTLYLKNRASSVDAEPRRSFSFRCRIYHMRAPIMRSPPTRPPMTPPMMAPR